MRDIVISSAMRTPIGDFGGSLKDVSAVSLAMRVIDSSLEGAGLEKKVVNQVIMGNCFEPLDHDAYSRDGKEGLDLGTGYSLRRWA